MPKCLPGGGHHGGQLQFWVGSSVLQLSTHSLHSGKGSIHRVVKDKTRSGTNWSPVSHVTAIGWYETYPKNHWGLSVSRRSPWAHGSYTARKVHVRWNIESEMSSRGCCFECLVPSWRHYFRRLWKEPMASHCGERLWRLNGSLVSASFASWSAMIWLVFVPAAVAMNWSVHQPFFTLMDWNPSIPQAKNKPLLLL